MVNPGSKLGPYEIVAPLGAGGMGEVYRARDPRLGRDVALKVLPASFASDADRMRRFEQEARAAAALNHPNIMAIFDIGTHEGVPYVVSELLEGETLRERVRPGPLSQRKAIDFALQVAKGLAAAHDKGIVHRDLKPENLFVTDDGRIKILDFGLAKLVLPEAGAASNAPTMEAHTDPGLVLGTVGYMSPEQVRGKPADARSDIFSFGAILYEMLSGKRAFHGETTADTLSSILKEDPPDLVETNRQVSPGVERIVRHCLEKGPAERFQSARDIAFDLETLSGTSSISRAGVPAVSDGARSRWMKLAAIAAVLVASYAAVFLVARRGGGAPPPNFHRLTYRRGSILSARFAPDGQTIIYGAAWDGNPTELFTTRSDSTESRPLGLGTVQVLGISHQGELALSVNVRTNSAFTQIGTLARAPLAGGAPRELLDGVQWADWTPDGTSLAVVATGHPGYANVLEFPAGKMIYGPAGWVSHVRFSPSGDLLAFADHVVAGDDGRVVVVDREGHKKVESGMYTTVEGVAWSSNGKEVWFSAAPTGATRAIYAMDMTGKIRLVLRVPSTLILQDISPSGRVLFSQENDQYNLFGLAPGAKDERNLSWFDWSVVGDMSADGKTVVFSETGDAVAGKYGIFLRATDGTPAVRLGDGGTPAALSPDGKWVVAHDQSVPSQLILLPTGVGEARQLTHDKVEHGRAAWLPDGKSIVFGGALAGKPPRVYQLSLSGGEARPVTPEGRNLSLVSPDGASLIVGSGSGKFEISPLAGSEARPVTGLEPGEFPVAWEADGKSIIVQNRGIPIKLTRVDLASGHRQDWKQITPSDAAGLITVSGVHLSADGKVYAYSSFRVLSDLYVVDGLK